MALLWKRLLKWLGWTACWEPRERDTYLGEVEEGRLTEQDVGQEHGAASQHFNLVFTVVVAPQKLTKVPGGGRVGRAELLVMS